MFKRKRKKANNRQPDNLPPGVRLAQTLTGHSDDVICVAFDPQGRTLASGSDDNTVKLWEVDSGGLFRTFKHPSDVRSVAFDPQGHTLASGGRGDLKVHLWEADSDQPLRVLDHEANDALCLAFDAQNRMLAGGTGNETARLWERNTGRLLHSLNHSGEVESVAFDPQGNTLASGNDGGSIKLWEPNSGRLLHSLDGHSDLVSSVAFDPPGHTLASGSGDKTIKLWEPNTGRLLRTLEGHTHQVAAIAFSPDGRALATLGYTDGIRIWNCKTWEMVAVIPASAAFSNVAALAFHSDPTRGRALLAAAGSDDENRIDLWELDLDVLLGGAVETESLHYKNAKVVLVGDSGVGKSGLALRMATSEFEATESTHGRRIWTMDSRTADGKGDEAPAERRETLLWDLAGQPSYRLIHQLNIDEAAVALVLIDSRSETDPLGPAEYWARAVDQARSSVPIVRFLVEARVDRGGLAVSREEIQRFCDRFGFAGCFQTSAKTGEGVDDLTQAVRERIAWDQLPAVVSTKLFTQIKDLLKEEKERGDQVLVEDLSEFYQRLAGQIDEPVTEEQFRTVVGRLAASDLAHFLIFTALDDKSNEATEYVLMQPEYIDGYASAIVHLARKDPRGIGHVSEASVRSGELGLPDTDRISNNDWAEGLVISETIEQLLGHDIALRERLDDGNYLVLPSQYTRRSPYPRTNAPGVTYEFEGAPRAIFTTLVVRLTHHQHFEATDFWRDAARYTMTDGGRFIIALEEPDPGHGRLTVYFEDDPPRNERVAFLDYVHRHLRNKALPDTIVAKRENRCSACGTMWDAAVVENRLKLGKPDIICPNCERRSPLIDLLLLVESDEAAASDAKLIDADADAARARQMAVTAIRGKEQAGQYDVFLSYNSKDRNAVIRVGEMLKGIGIRPWLDVWDLIPGQPWQDQLEEAINKVRSAAICVGPSATGPWQDQEIAAFIRKFVRNEAPVMPVILPGLDETPDLPTFLEAFMWVDLRELSDTNPRPLANLVAGIAGRRPDEMRADSLAEQVAAVLTPTRRDEKSMEVTEDLPSIVLPVNRPELTETELDAVVTQTAQLLGISTRRVRLVTTEPGSVKVILQLDDMTAVSQLFAKVDRGDSDLLEFFKRCHIAVDDFQNENESVPPELQTRREERNAELPDEVDRELRKLPHEELKAFVGGAEVATLAIVFTDIVDSTKLCEDLGDATWDQIRRVHFAHVLELIREAPGQFIKNTGDGVLACFHNAEAAVTFARDLVQHTGHAVVRVRIGVHIGAVTIESDDTFGRHVNMAARVMGTLESDGVVISHALKDNLDSRGEPSLKNLNWEQRDNVSLKGVSDAQTLWRLAQKG